MTTSELGRITWSEWVPAALASGNLRPFPKPLIHSKGLEGIQSALERYGQGVSAQKIVVDMA
jgi:hypothetical protein